MSGDSTVNLVFLGIMLLLPLSSLIARRVPIVRVALSLAGWAAIFAVGLLILGHRERFDPYLSKLTRLLRIDDQTVVGRDVKIRMSPDGHFWGRVKINGVERRMLIDSGATITALSTSTAAAAGLDVHQDVFPTILRTANGSISAETSTVAQLRLGDVVARNLAVVVSPAFGDADVLGMNFLSRLKSWRVEGNTLIMSPHHPQDFT